MSDVHVFQSAQAFDDSTQCELKTCKSNVIAYTTSTCEPSYVATKSLDGRVDADAFDPQLFRYNDSANEGSLTPLMLAQKSSWDMNDDSATFIVPCFQVNAKSVGDNTQDRNWSALVVLGFILARHQWSSSNQTQKLASGLWEDDVITANRIPMEKVRFLKIISSGTLGEIYAGVYNDERVAVKMLLPSSRRDVKLVNEFLTEAKLTATLEHPHIVTFIGVVWDTFSDLCIVLEFVDVSVEFSEAVPQSIIELGNACVSVNPSERPSAVEALSKLEVILSKDRGAFGEVYAGTYNNERVAIKMLLSSTRRDIKLVSEFLTEAKLTASMEHPRIVACIGIAWDSLSDLCVVLEFMDGGDLRTLLSNYEKEGHPIGFDREKVTIALHVAHALTYLHSLDPPVIHRDLKSRNILLSGTHEAKLIDFGISRERLDRTMTAGVGTSLWMAPEVMTGEKYDDKADVFSFGVVLSELDSHTLPYTQVKQEMLNTHGRQITDATLLQRVAMGTVAVEFSKAGP
ncbi:hypothetical protein PHYSODRAFT_324321 [Phytophthora sojae]|uniref:Protein kinase domain-containing protein n=1 Tax=Phytophthora sojae (strain P6497) TaxID=1094619 RepID=G4YTD9_PHYSP|nr:hypothetical protein PHYSODRAFT_324321 [Phytophthora sojae]EGZ23061.1 hypothetical protein PHYSODRAFT_324321 [Phytophthora sojae]|eukprot:XP_009518349.1 hypothetical protein PHYSODRAFT_324321 [Phytophthora sojae]